MKPKPRHISNRVNIFRINYRCIPTWLVQRMYEVLLIEATLKGIVKDAVQRGE